MTADKEWIKGCLESAAQTCKDGGMSEADTLARLRNNTASLNCTPDDITAAVHATFDPEDGRRFILPLPKEYEVKVLAAALDQLSNCLLLTPERYIKLAEEYAPGLTQAVQNLVRLHNARSEN